MLHRSSSTELHLTDYIPIHATRVVLSMGSFVCNQKDSMMAIVTCLGRNVLPRGRTSRFHRPSLRSPSSPMNMAEDAS